MLLLGQILVPQGQMHEERFVGTLESRGVLSACQSKFPKLNAQYD
jgi:hypothetical protein